MTCIILCCRGKMLLGEIDSRNAKIYSLLHPLDVSYFANAHRESKCSTGTLTDMWVGFPPLFLPCRMSNHQATTAFHSAVRGNDTFRIKHGAKIYHMGTFFIPTAWL